MHNENNISHNENNNYLAELKRKAFDKKRHKQVTYGLSYEHVSVVQLGHEAIDRAEADSHGDTMSIPNPAQKFQSPFGRVVGWAYYTRKPIVKGIGLATMRQTKERSLKFTLKGMTWVNASTAGRHEVTLPQNQQWEV